MGIGIYTSQTRLMGGIHALALADWRRDGAFSEALPGNEWSMAEFGPLIKLDSLPGNASSSGRRQAFTETDARGRFELQELPDEPLSLMAHMQPKGADRKKRFPVRVNATANQKDIRIVLDPSPTKED